MFEISPKEWQKLAEFEVKFPGCLRVESAGRNHARLWISNGTRADRWTFTLDPGLTISRTTSFSRELGWYARLRARETMLAVRTAHREHVERMRAQKAGRPISKKLEHRRAQAAQYALPLESHTVATPLCDER